MRKIFSITLLAIAALLFAAAPMAFVPTPTAQAAVANPNFAFVGSAQIDHVDADGQVTLDMPMVQMYNAASGQLIGGDLKTAPFAPNVANARSAMTTAVVNAYQQAFGGTLPVTSVAVPTYQVGN